jgi:hypothetical protein
VINRNESALIARERRNQANRNRRLSDAPAPKDKLKSAAPKTTH